MRRASNQQNLSAQQTDVTLTFDRKTDKLREMTSVPPGNEFQASRRASVGKPFVVSEAMFLHPKHPTLPILELHPIVKGNGSQEGCVQSSAFTEATSHMPRQANWKDISTLLSPNT